MGRYRPLKNAYFPQHGRLPRILNRAREAGFCVTGWLSPDHRRENLFEHIHGVFGREWLHKEKETIGRFRTGQDLLKTGNRRFSRRGQQVVSLLERINILRVHPGKFRAGTGVRPYLPVASEAFIPPRPAYAPLVPLLQRRMNRPAAGLVLRYRSRGSHLRTSWRGANKQQARSVTP